MQKAYFNISVNGKDITERVLSFEYDGSVEKDNILKLKIKPEFSMLSNDDDDIIAGNKIDFFWGLVGGKISSKRVAIIKDLDPIFSVGDVSLTITAFDKGNSAKKNPSQTIWRNKKLSDIVRDIAERNALGYKVKETSRVYKSLAQSNKNDFEFLQDLSRDEEPGNWIVYLEGDEIILDQRDFSKNAEFLFEWGVPESKIFSFKPSYKESEKDASDVTIVSTVFNPETLQVEQQTAKETDKALGKYVYDADSKELAYINNYSGVEKRPVLDVFKPLENFLSNNVSNSKIQEFDTDHSHVNQTKKNNAVNDKKRRTLIGDLQVIGDPLYNYGIIITITNVGKKYSGNWYVKGVRHIMNSAGDYRTHLSLQKNGTAAKITRNPSEKDSVNNSVGSNNAKNETIKKKQYDGNGKEVNSVGGIVSKSIRKIGR